MTMKSFFSMKAVRFLLSLSVSFWIAGGCLFGCSNTAMGAGVEHQAPTVVVAHHSCHAKHSNAPTGVPSCAPSPREMMKECPLVVNAAAATSKSSGQLPDPGRGPAFTLPLIEKNLVQSNIPQVVAFLPNRGPTHLRCCVFLI